jgi:hypothetical protein
MNACARTDGHEVALAEIGDADGLDTLADDTGRDVRQGPGEGRSASSG